jgi:HPt (histidine-containing phosphotransfer) domain-containing protein
MSLNPQQLAGANPPRLLDLERAVGMMGSDVALKKILQTVQASLSSSLPVIWQLLDSGDVAGVQAQLHTIKGYAPIFCSDDLIEQVVQAERLSKTETVQVVRPVWTALAPQFEQLLAEIQAYLLG